MGNVGLKEEVFGVGGCFVGLCAGWCGVWGLMGGVLSIGTMVPVYRHYIFLGVSFFSFLPGGNLEAGIF